MATWVTGGLSLLVMLGGAWFQQPAPPTSCLFTHFRLSGSDAQPRWRRPAPPTLSFKNALQKPTGAVTDTTSMLTPRDYYLKCLCITNSDCLFKKMRWEKYGNQNINNNQGLLHWNIYTLLLTVAHSKYQTKIRTQIPIITHKHTQKRIMRVF